MNLSTTRNSWPTTSQAVQAIALPRLPSALGSIKPLEARRDLTKKEKDQLTQCESVLDHGLGTFFEVGNALLTIRDERLYRATHQTFESYCRERWGIGRTYAWRSIGAAQRLRLLPARADFPRPANEFQIRPFLKLEPDKFPAAWEQVAKRAKQGKITSKCISRIIEEMAPELAKKRRTTKNNLKSQKLKKQSLGQILVLIQEAIRAIEKSQPDHAISCLQRMEELLFGGPGPTQDSKKETR